VRRLVYNRHVAAGQLAVVQGAPRPHRYAKRCGRGEVPISGFIRVEVRAGLAVATPKNSPLAAARRVALKMGRRRRCSSVTYQFRYVPAYRQSGSDRLPAAHFERNDMSGIYETTH
jgi:hypothetical protein